MRSIQDSRIHVALNYQRDPDFEYGLGNYLNGNNGVTSQDGSHFYSGTKSLKLVTDPAGGGVNVTAGAIIPSVKGMDRIYGRVMAFLPATNTGTGTGFRIGGVGVDATSTPFYNDKGVWFEIKLDVAVLPDGTSPAVMYLTGSNGPNDVVYFDQVYLGTDPDTTWFTGDSPGAVWLDTPGEGPSANYFPLARSNKVVNQIINPSFEGGLDGWNGGGGTLTLMTDGDTPGRGPNYCRYMRADTAGGRGPLGDPSNFCPVHPGQWVTVSALVRGVGTGVGASWRMGLNTYPADGGAATVNVAVPAPMPAEWTRVQHTYLVPEGVATVLPRAYFTSGQTGTEVMDVDDWIMTVGDAVYTGPYFDGTSMAARWQGPPDSSASAGFPDYM